MNKKLFSLIAAAVVAAACAVGFAACGHTHEMTHYAAKQATCTEDGNVEYWYCGGCEKYFADENGGEELESIVVEAAGHRWDEGRVTKEPACTEDGERTFTCTVCKTTRTEAIEAVGHTFSEEWSGDSTYHWRAATCGHADMVADRGEHTWQDGVCSVCARVRTEGLDYALSADGTYYTVSGIGKCAESNIFIPSAYNGLPVRAIADRAFYGCAGLTSVILPNGLESIGEEAFYECFALENISIPESVKKIDAYALSRCMALESVVLPDSVIVVSKGMFSDCGSLKSVTLGDAVTELGDSAFYGCSALTDINIPDSVWIIGCSAFEYCGFKSVTLPGRLGYMADNMFTSCKNLESVTLPEGLKNIGEYAFTACTNLKSINIPQSVEAIGSSAFSDCTCLKNIVIPEGVNVIGSSAFAACTGLTDIVLPESLVRVCPSAFSGCGNLKSVTIGNKVETIDYLAFSYCSALTDIKFNGTMAEWNGIKKGEDWDSGAGNYTVHCTDGDISKKD